jgi:transcription antitermination factor NusG
VKPHGNPPRYTIHEQFWPQSVVILTGPFAGMQGELEDIHEATQRVRVRFSLGGYPAVIDLQITEIGLGPEVPPE